MFILSILLIFFKTFIYLFLSLDNIFLFEIIFSGSISVCYLLKKLYILINNNTEIIQINLNGYKIKKPYLSMVVFFSYLISIFLILFSIKLFNVSREINLVILYKAVINKLNIITLEEKICHLIFFVIFLLVFMYLLKLIKNFIYTEMIKIHIYLNITEFYLDFYGSILTSYSIYKLESFLSRHLINWFGEAKRNLIYSLVSFLVLHLSLILIIIFFFFDLLFNNFVLSKIFYIFPFCFLYSQWVYITKFYFSKDILLDNILHKYLYFPRFFEDDTIIIFSDGSAFEEEARLALYTYIKKGFKNEYF